MSDDLPPLPEPIVPEGDWFIRDSYIKDYARAYGRQCRNQALEEAALTCRYLPGFAGFQCGLFEAAVLELKDKP